jgi:hypothetical protein
MLRQHGEDEWLSIAADRVATQGRNLDCRIAREPGRHEVLRDSHSLVNAGTTCGEHEVDGDTVKPPTEV